MPRASYAVHSSPPKDLNVHDFRSLSVKDLLDARDQFHVHLANKPNVFATAIGLYLIRDQPHKGQSDHVFRASAAAKHHRVPC